MTESPSELTDHLGYWLRLLSNHVSHAFARKLAGRDVSVAEWVLMRLLYSDGAAPSWAAEQMGMTRGAITKLADRLVRKGLVVRTADPGDGRAQILALTAEGRVLAPQLAALADQNEAECFAHLPPAERAELERIVRWSVGRLGLAAHPLD